MVNFKKRTINNISSDQERVSCKRIAKCLALNVLEFSLILATTACSYSQRTTGIYQENNLKTIYSGPSCAINIPGYSPHRHPWQQ
jgi:hypothetical protein